MKYSRLVSSLLDDAIRIEIARRYRISGGQRSYQTEMLEKMLKDGMEDWVKVQALNDMNRRSGVHDHVLLNLIETVIPSFRRDDCAEYDGVALTPAGGTIAIEAKVVAPRDGLGTVSNRSGAPFRMNMVLMLADPEATTLELMVAPAATLRGIAGTPESMNGGWAFAVTPKKMAVWRAEGLLLPLDEGVERMIGLVHGIRPPRSRQRGRSSR